MESLLEGAIRRESMKIIWKYFRHIRLPQAMLAKVTKGGKIVTLKILDEDENEDERFAEIPDLPTLETWTEGDIVIITFLYGKIELPIILRKWEKCH